MHVPIFWLVLGGIALFSGGAFAEREHQVCDAVLGPKKKSDEVADATVVS